jgi:uncharacterized protein YfiM (DUF2279 family)
MKHITALILALSAFSAQADEWTGADKALHFTLGAAISAGVGVHYRDPMKGFLVGAGVGIAKELLDKPGGGSMSGKDAAVTILGAAVGAAGAHVIISPRFIGYRTEF